MKKKNVIFYDSSFMSYTYLLINKYFINYDKVITLNANTNIFIN